MRGSTVRLAVPDLTTLWTAAVSAVVLLGCRTSDLLTVPTPANLLSGAQVRDSAGAEALRRGAVGDFGMTLQGNSAGVILWSGVLADEFVWAEAAVQSAQADARLLSGLGSTRYDATYTKLQKVRVELEAAVNALEQPAAHGPASEIAELFALEAYTELILAEQVCTGDPLSELNADGTVAYGAPLPTDSIFLRALSHLDSAAAHVGGSTAVGNLIAIGKGRALIGLGRFAEAAASVSGVPVSFIYGTHLPNNYAFPFYVYFAENFVTAGDRKGTNGLAFVSARDPRVVTMPFGQTSVGTPDNFPTMFPNTLAGSSNIAIGSIIGDSIALADGVEAALITAEAALAAHDTSSWLMTLNQLRANYTAIRGPYPADTSYHPLGPLSDPGADTSRVTLTFQERGFWLYGTGRRLGDLRRLVRQYGRDQGTVFPSGAYQNGSLSSLFPSYGNSVAFPIGTVESSNPNFHGCSSTQA